MVFISPVLAGVFSVLVQIVTGLFMSFFLAIFYIVILAFYAYFITALYKNIQNYKKFE
ncbi:TPA: hypothetical protein HA316_06305 [Candidatus Micrarchaeota archaeon]|nr:hypothetical protein [Candidatus Micrarchaeota archaeon]